eukprot:10901324-Prorocentrum_lima.AAC.1
MADGGVARRDAAQDLVAWPAGCPNKLRQSGLANRVHAIGGRQPRRVEAVREWIPLLLERLRYR